ncbi:hypothetical protein SAMN05421820_110158 [Pedobacter steynii]|uniref:Uncharacterized protein n=1 Tax=Pedobacter steynii TaxID=430522 RepID=A0A1H0FER4_9SPHI|nr:hypothetical protein SAMN05421820_110158 [Pedobacter steynii]
MKKAIYILALIIVVVISFELLQMVITNKYYHINELFLLATLLMSMFYRTRVTWFFVLIICLLGAYNLMFIQPKYSSPTIFNFTYTMYIPLLSKVNMYVINAIAVLPILFYLFTAIVFLTKPIRSKYWPQSKTNNNNIKVEHRNVTANESSEF